MRQLRIDFSEFEFAFESSRDLLSFYLESETDEIIPFSVEDQYEINKITRSYPDEKTGAIDWERAFQEENIADWQQEGLQNVLLQYPAERQRWFQFKRVRLHQYMLDWLKAQGIEPIPV